MLVGWEAKIFLDHREDGKRTLIVLDVREK
jgi:hypothetical protein